jgi:hypothetical protein
VSTYNPVARRSGLYRIWLGLDDPPSRTNWPDPGLEEEYLTHLDVPADRSRPTSVSAFVGPSRPIVGDFVNLLAAIDLGPPFGDLLSNAGIEVYFPVLDEFDARSVGSAIFISSRYLDAIEFFSDRISAWSALNAHLSDRALPPATWPIPYAWLPFLVNQGYIDLDEVSAEYVDYHNSLRQDFLRGMITVVFVPAIGTRSVLQAGPQKVRGNQRDFIEPRYLAAVTLLFVYLHECAHILLAHNAPTLPRSTPFQQALEDSIDRYIEKLNDDAGEVVAGRLWDEDSSLQSSMEATADFHAVRSTMAEAGDTVLEAASLWLTALGTCRPGGADVFDALKQSTGDEHPPYPTRVWALNGALSTLGRQGHVARAVRRAAEVMAGEAVPFKPELNRSRVPLHRGGFKRLRLPWRERSN